jgi:hypothetical protein
MVDMIRQLLTLAAVAGAVLALGACGSGKNNNNSPRDEQDKAFAGSLKFAKCMREHGIDMPDPTRANGGGILQKMGGPGERVRIDGSKMKAADKACAKYRELGGGDAPDPAAMAKQRDAFVAYARCMRGKGINMPDPKVSGNGIQMSIDKGIRPDSAVFKAADKACHTLLGRPPGEGPDGNGPDEVGRAGGGTSFPAGPTP